MTRITLGLLILFCVYYLIDPLPFGLENYDSFELVTAMVTGGVAHPPGYGFYLELNRWFHECLSFWNIEPALSMTYFQSFCCFIAMLIFLRMIRLWQGSGLLFIFLIMSCASFTPNLYSIEVYGLLILLLSLSLKLYFFRISMISERSQNLLLGIVIALMVSHHLSLAPVAAIMIYRRFVEYRFSLALILGLITGVILSVYLNYQASQSIMNPWFDGSSPIAIWQHLTAKVYQVAFLNYGFHIDAWQNFISVWPLEIWALIILVLIYSIKGMKSELHLAFLVLLIWPLFIYNIPDISKPLITLYVLTAVIVACTKTNSLLYIILLALSCFHSLMEVQKSKFLGLSYKARSMEQSIKDAHVAVSKKPSFNHTFIGYDSIFGVAYSRHVIRSRESLKMSFFPMWWLSFKPHLGSMLNHQFSSKASESRIVHWSGFSRSKLKQLYSSSNHLAKDFGTNIIYPKTLQFEQLKRSLKILDSESSILYLPSGKPDLMKYFTKLGFSFVNRGFWNELKLDKHHKHNSDAIVQRVYLQKIDVLNYFVHIIFLEQIDQELELKLSNKDKWIGSRVAVSNQARTFFKLPIESIDDRATKLKILSEDRLLSEVTLVID